MQKIEKNGLQGYSLKFTDSQWRDVQIHLAVSESLKYKYELFNKVVTDSSDNDLPSALAFPVVGKTTTCYINSGLSDSLEKLAKKMNCKPVTALYTLIINFMENAPQEMT